MSQDQKPESGTNTTPITPSKSESVTAPSNGAAKKPAAPEKTAVPPQPGSKPAAPAASTEKKPASALGPVESKAAAGKPAKRPPEPIDPADAHVLVVEDNVPNFVLIARLLAYMGIQRCEWKTSGWQVVEFADTLPRIDLILMDIRLPYEDGFQALEKVRANDHLKDTLVVAVTAEASVEQMKRAQESGFDGFLGKPLDADRFPEQIQRILRGEQVWEIH